MLESIRRLVGISPADRDEIAEAARVAVSTGDNAQLRTLARRLADAAALDSVRGLAAEAEAKRAAEAERIEKAAVRDARWRVIAEAVDRRNAAAVEVTRAIDALGASLAELHAACVTINSQVGRREIDKFAGLLEISYIHSAVRDALSKHSLLIGDYVALPPLGNAPPPPLTERFARAGSEIMSHRPAPGS